MDVFATALIVVGLVTLVWPRWFANRAKARHDRRMAELRAGAEEAFFEEQRSLVAYPPSPPRRWNRVYGGLLVLLGLAHLYYF